MKRGQTIVANREKLQSASERMEARQKQKRKRNFRLAIGVTVAVIVVVGVMIGWQELARSQQEVTTEVPLTEPQAELVDESGSGKIPSSTKEYAATLEADLKDLGYTVTRITLPNGMIRELYIDLEGQSAYYKVNTDRAPAVTAEDIDRMVKYLREHDVQPEYVDVRVEGKAFYK